jgi:S1-C subfamily serine protease
MSALAETYLRQARSFLLAGEPERSVELLKKAKVMCAKEPHLMVTVLQDLYNACKLAGRIEEAGNYYLQLQALVGTTENSSQVPARSRGRLWAWSLAASVLFISTIPVIWWILRGGHSTTTNGPTSLLSAREKLLRSDVGMVVVIGQYSGNENGKQYNWDVGLATGSCFPIRSDGYLLTNRHVVVDGGSIAPTTLAVRGYPWFNLVRVTYVVCFGSNASDHLAAELCGTSSRLDLAVLRVHRTFADPLVLGEQAPHQGDDVFVAGYPGAVSDYLNETNLNPARFQELFARSAQAGYLNDLDLLFDAEAFTPQLNRGIVSVARRVIGGVVHVQFDGVAGHGNSGGPLLDASNRVMGMVTLGLPDAEGKGNNWAITAEELRRELQSLPPIASSTSSGDAETASPQLTVPQTSPSVVSLVPAQPSNPGLRRAGYSPERCLICNSPRSVKAAIAYSDDNGFGLCDNCGTCYRAWERVLMEAQQGIVSSDSDRTLADEFKSIMSSNFHSDDEAGRRGIGPIFMLGKFASSEWNALTRGY